MRYTRLSGGTETLFQHEGMALKDLRAELIPLGRAGKMLGKKTAPLDKDEGS
jgi:hypothetical protein